MFLPPLTKILRKEAKGIGGRPPYDCILMYKTLVIKRLYNLSDEQTEFQINDRISFMRFLGLTLSDKVPDAKTIWYFENSLKKTNHADEKRFDRFLEFLEKQGVITHKGTIVDATFVDASKAKHKLAQKDTEARWTKKGNETHYGYKDHAKVDADSKLITNYEVTSASIHDSQCFVDMLDKNDNAIYADSTYAGEKSKIRARIEHVFGYMTNTM